LRAKGELRAPLPFGEARYLGMIHAELQPYDNLAFVFLAWDSYEHNFHAMLLRAECCCIPVPATAY
jgi:hypothetical protein